MFSNLEHVCSEFHFYHLICGLVVNAASAFGPLKGVHVSILVYIRLFLQLEKDFLYYPFRWEGNRGDDTAAGMV